MRPRAHRPGNVVAKRMRAASGCRPHHGPQHRPAAGAACRLPHPHAQPRSTGRLSSRSLPVFEPCGCPGLADRPSRNGARRRRPEASPSPTGDAAGNELRGHRLSGPDGPEGLGLSCAPDETPGAGPGAFSRVGDPCRGCNAAFSPWPAGMPVWPRASRRPVAPAGRWSGRPVSDRWPADLPGAGPSLRNGPPIRWRWSCG